MSKARIGVRVWNDVWGCDVGGGGVKRPYDGRVDVCLSWQTVQTVDYVCKTVDS